MKAKTNPKAQGAVSASLPAFVIERNTRAIGAGLRITKQRVSRWLLSTVYEGEPEAIIKAGFVDDIPAFRKAIAAPTKSISSNSHRYLAQFRNPLTRFLFPGLYRAEGGNVRLTFTREPIPKRSWKVSESVDGYEAFGKYEGLFNIYTAPTLDALDRADVLPEKARVKALDQPQFYQWHDVRGGVDAKWEDGTRYQVWGLNRNEDGTFWRLSVFPLGMKRAAKEDRQRAKTSLKTADQYRDHLTEILGLFEGCISSAFSVVTRDGKQYSLDSASRERLELLLTDAANIITTATIHTTRDPDLVAEDEAKRKAQMALHSKLSEAGNNVELQQFLAKVIPLASRRNDSNA